MLKMSVVGDGDGLIESLKSRIPMLVVGSVDVDGDGDCDGDDDDNAECLERKNRKNRVSTPSSKKIERLMWGPK